MEWQTNALEKPSKTIFWPNIGPHAIDNDQVNPLT